MRSFFDRSALLARVSQPASVAIFSLGSSFPDFFFRLFPQNMQVPFIKPCTSDFSMTLHRLVLMHVFLGDGSSSFGVLVSFVRLTAVYFLRHEGWYFLEESQSLSFEISCVALEYLSLVNCVFRREAARLRLVRTLSEIVLRLLSSSVDSSQMKHRETTSPYCLKTKQTELVMLWSHYILSIKVDSFEMPAN